MERERRAAGASVALRGLYRLHREVDEAAGLLAARLGDRLRCRRGCHECCVDGISVFEIEAARIRQAHAGLLATGRPRAQGRCAFLDEHGACRIYDARPYVCRTQGLPLRWLEGRDAGECVELRDICPLNEIPGEPLEALAEGDCWTIGPHEARLAALQAAFGGEGGRVRLRDLFRRPDAGPPRR